MFFHFPDTYRTPQLPGIPNASVGEFSIVLPLWNRGETKDKSANTVITEL